MGEIRKVITPGEKGVGGDWKRSPGGSSEKILEMFCFLFAWYIKDIDFISQQVTTHVQYYLVHVKE